MSKLIAGKHLNVSYASKDFQGKFFEMVQSSQTK